MSRQKNETQEEILPETVPQETAPQETPQETTAQETPQETTAQETPQETTAQETPQETTAQETVRARILADCEHGRANGIAEVSAAEAAAHPCLDPDPGAVAYAESLAHA